MTEHDRLSERLKRYAKVTTKLSGATVRLAGHHYLGFNLDSHQHAAELGRVLGELKGPVMKIAQLLATIPGALPPEYTQALQHLQSQAPSMGWPFVKRRMMGELGPQWQTKFSTFEPTAAAAASLGQVHKATDLRGNTLACKLQYPDMQSTIEADLAQLRLILKVYESYDKVLTSDEILQEIAQRLREELDYTREAHHIEMFRAMLSSVPQIHIPRVYSDLSTTRLLTMDWLEGEPLLNVKDNLSSDKCNAIAHTLFHSWYFPFYHYGVIHGDPHLGNYTLRADHSINLLDFGCIRIFSPRFVKGVIDLYHALERNDLELANEAYKGWGFTNLSTAMTQLLNQWASYLYGPLLDDRVRPIDPEYNANQGREIAAHIYQELRRLGGLAPPREFVFMDRAAVGLGAAFMHLKAEINWHQEFHALIRDFDADRLEERQKAVLAKEGLNYC